MVWKAQGNSLATTTTTTGEVKMTNLEQKRRAAFEEWYMGRFGVDPVGRNGQLTEQAYYCYESWKGSLEWQNKGERE